jgi:hypothetical protein
MECAHLLQANALGIVAALNIEHAGVRPAVFIIANERPLRIS